MINIGSNENYYDIKAGQAFIQQWRDIRTGNQARANEAAFEITELIREIFGYQVLIIDPSNDNKSLRLIIDGRSYGIHELGSGFIQFLITLVNVATERPAFLLVDEPELSLHATLQMRYLTTLGRFAEEGVLFATHSMGLARAASERIYSLRRLDNGPSEVNVFGDTRRLSEFLGELNYGSYQELGYDGILLVEGPTEIKVFHELLRIYKKDHRFVMLSLGGDDMIGSHRETELVEIKRISSNILALIDSEKGYVDAPLKNSRQGFIDICSSIGITCHVLEYRSTENYFTQRALNNIFSGRFLTLKPYETFGKAKPSWGKGNNWRIARERPRMSSTRQIWVDSSNQSSSGARAHHRDRKLGAEKAQKLEPSTHTTPQLRRFCFLSR